MASGYDDDRDGRHDDRREDDAERRRPGSADLARRKVGIPAILMILNGILGLIFAATLFTFLVVAPDTLLDFLKQTVAAQPAGPEKKQNEDQIKDLEDKLKQDPAANAISTGLELGVFSILNLVAIVGAFQMRAVKSYGFGMAASIITMIPCATGCCCTGPLIGVWGLIVLLSQPVKDGFAAARTARSNPHDGY